MSDLFSGSALILENTVNGYTVYNENLWRLESLCLNSAISKTTAVQPASPEEGDLYIIPAGASGEDWTDFTENEIAFYINGAWLNVLPRDGWMIWVADEGEYYLYQNNAWSKYAGSLSVDHGGLIGLADDDHSQYLHLDLVRTITAQHIFSPTAEQAPFTLGTNAQGQLVSGLNADQLDGYDAGDFAFASHSHTKIQDTDGDTSIETEAVPDEDHIRFSLGGVEQIDFSVGLFEFKVSTNIVCSGGTISLTDGTGGVSVGEGIVSLEGHGVLFPCLTTAQMEAIESPAESMMIWNTDEKVFCHFDGTQWVYNYPAVIQ